MKISKTVRFVTMFMGSSLCLSALSQSMVKPDAESLQDMLLMPKTSAEKPQQPAVLLPDDAQPALPVLKHLPLEAMYQADKVNYIAASGVNALVSPRKLAAFIPQPGAVDFEWINGHRGLVFQLRNPALKTFQAILVLSGKLTPLSVFFEVDRIPGRVIRLSRHLVAGDN